MVPDAERIGRLRAYCILDRRAPEPALEALARRAREASGAAFAWLSLFDGEREWLVARSGLTGAERFCEPPLAFARGMALPAFVEDAPSTPFSHHPWIEGGPRIRFFAAIPLTCPDGLVVGSLVVADPDSRSLSASERSALANLASLALARLEARREGIAPIVRAPAAPLVEEQLDQEIQRRRELEGRLEHERRLSDALVQSFPGAFFLVSPEGLIVRWNSGFAAATGHPDNEIKSRHPLDFVTPHDRPALDRALRAVLEREEEVSLEAEIVDRVGNVRPYAISGRPVRLGGRTYMIGIGSDITLRRRTEQQMARAKERLDLALASSSLALWDWDLRLNRVYFDENWTQLLGNRPAECTFSGDEVLAWNHPDDRAVFEAALGNATKGVSEEFDCEYRVSNAAGEWIWIHSRGKVTQRDERGHALRMTGTSNNVTKRKAAEERAEYLATRDALTGLPNRVLLHDRLEQAVVNAARQRVAFAFMFIDLDRFKTINDSLGHHVGDELLKCVASRLTSCVRASDTVARLGGDEFAVILENLRDGDEGAQQVAEKMIDAMAMPILIEGQHLTTSCSIGISLFPGDARDTRTLMKHADVAMYFAKEKGRNNYQFFSSEMNVRAQDRLAVENYLRLALRRNELVLHYQPRLSFATGELVAVEALIRWQHPRRGLVHPDTFIEVAEDSGLIVPIGEWVIDTACAQIAVWQKTVRPALRLSVNLSVGQVVDAERLYTAVAKSLLQSAIDPTTLELELTESLLMQNLGEKAALLHRLGRLGVGLSIDDFGTGYSSLAYLKSLPVDSIKVDSSFVRDVHADPNDEAIIQAIVAMAHSLKLSVVAEGVETAEQFRRLRDLGCDEYQGFYESEALAPPQLEAKYARR